MSWRSTPTPIGFHRESYTVEESHGQLYDFPIEDHGCGHHFGNAFYHRQPADIASQNYGVVTEKEVKKKVQFGSDNNSSMKAIKKEEVGDKADVNTDIDSAANDFIRRKHELFTKQRLMSLQGKT